MNKYLRKIYLIILSAMLCSILVSESYVVEAKEVKIISKESLLSLDSSSLIKTLELKGLRLPSDYEQHKELAQSFASKYVPLLMENKINPYIKQFSYDQSNEMMVELAKVLTSMELFKIENVLRYTLKDSTVLGSWSNSYDRYNCYAYSLGKTFGLQPGTTSRTKFSMTFSISQMADVVIADLNSMGFRGYKTTKKPKSLPDKWFRVICIRKDNDNVDYHFMKCGANLNSWTHKPGGTQPLRWKYSSPGAKVWSNEHVYKGIAEPGNITYESDIYYTIYKGKNDPGIQPNSYLDYK